MKFYDFFEKQPKIDGLVIIEGTDSILAQRALEAVLDRLVPPDLRSLNVDLFDGPSTDKLAGTVADAVAAMPFLADRRVVVVRGCERLRAAPRRDLWAAVEAIPQGNTLVLEDLFAPTKKTKPEPYGALAGRKALRIDTTVNAEVRSRFVEDFLLKNGMTADRPALAALAGSDADLGAIAGDLEKLALGSPHVTLADLERESLAVENPKAYQYAAALVEGRTADALAIAFELFATDARGAAVPLASALAVELGLVWELARAGGGELGGRHRWRERSLAPIARRIGERRARYGFEAAVRGFEAVVTGRIDDPRLMIELLTADVAAKVSAVAGRS